MSTSTLRQLPPKLNLELSAGKPFAFTVTTTGATITSPEIAIRTTAGDATSLAFSDVLQLSDDTVCSINATDSGEFNTTTRPKSYLWELTAVVDGFGPYPLLAGVLTAHPVGATGVSTSTTATLAVTVGDASIDLAVSVGGDVAEHIADTTGAHAASVISVADTGGYFTGTTVETVLAEIASSFARTYQSVNTVTAATYTFVAADQADIVVGNSASAQTFTVPPTSDVAATIGSRIDVVQKGAGAVSIAAGSGVTIVPAPGALATTAGVGSVCSLTLMEANTWYLSGALARTDVLFIPANEMRSARGVPSLDNYAVGTAEASPPVWLLDASSRESVIAAVIPPWGWNTARVDLWWGNTSTSSGDVVWELTYQAPVTNGDTLSASGTATNVTVAAPTGTTRDVKVSTLLASVALAPGKLLAFGVSRRASDAGDTLANDAKLIGVALVRLT